MKGQMSLRRNIGGNGTADRYPLARKYFLSNDIHI